ncbi:hypothetical protein ASG88_11235 [Nocardioides sp. Soil777]|uniref:DUF3237 domain-containing protein n=1 Tax=Nocardioides sp. Soil777 TaxID=1736409 RepID=UPI0007038389|nr:DUF3237 domain-containing protein [Nocardioides sp. Soil777]KRF00965.1 hypothetical protein ASG88_11235 [Nocardioides sp. Soil777]
MELVPFCTFTATPLAAKPDFAGRTPLGQRVVVGVRDGRCEGERFNASQRGDSAADWLLIGPDGTAIPDVRMALRTDDGAFVYMEYQGRGDASAGLDGATMYTAITFEIEDERYAWMNARLFVGKGSIDTSAGQVRYEVFEVR